MDYAIRVIQKEVEKLCNEKVKETELQKVKDIIKGELLRIVDSPSNFPEFMASYEIRYETEYAVLNYFNKIENTSSNAISEVAEKYLSEDQLSLVTLSPKIISQFFSQVFFTLQDCSLMLITRMEIKRQQ